MIHEREPSFPIASSDPDGTSSRGSDNSGAVSLVGPMAQAYSGLLEAATPEMVRADIEAGTAPLTDPAAELARRLQDARSVGIMLINAGVLPKDALPGAEKNKSEKPAAAVGCAATVPEAAARPGVTSSAQNRSQPDARQDRAPEIRPATGEQPKTIVGKLADKYVGYLDLEAHPEGMFISCKLNEPDQRKSVDYCSYVLDRAGRLVTTNSAATCFGIPRDEADPEVQVGLKLVDSAYYKGMVGMEQVPRNGDVERNMLIAYRDGEGYIRMQYFFMHDLPYGKAHYDKRAPRDKVYLKMPEEHWDSTIDGRGRVVANGFIRDLCAHPELMDTVFWHSPLGKAVAGRASDGVPRIAETRQTRGLVVALLPNPAALAGLAYEDRVWRQDSVLKIGTSFDRALRGAVQEIRTAGGSYRDGYPTFANLYPHRRKRVQRDMWEKSGKKNVLVPRIVEVEELDDQRPFAQMQVTVFPYSKPLGGKDYARHF